MLKWEFFLSYVNRYDLILNTLESFKDQRVYDKMIIYDSSYNNELMVREDFPYKKNVISPETKLSMTQFMNIATKRTLEFGANYWMMTHTDVQLLTPNSIQIMIDFVENIKDTRWGIVYVGGTLHFMALNVEMFQDIGWLDQFLPNYFSDNDLLYRMKLNNWSFIQNTQIETHHENGGSRMIYSDPILLTHNHKTFPLWKQYYIQKWGGKPGEEKFVIPFNKPELKDYCRMRGIIQ